MRGLVVLLLILPAWAGEDPWAKAQQDEFDRLVRQIELLRDPRWRTRALDLQRQFRSGTWSEREKSGREVHAVSLFRGVPTDPNARPRPRAPTHATVELKRTGCPVVLVLCNYEAIEWRIKLAPGVRLERVLLSGRNKQLVRGVDPKLVQPVDRRFVLNRREAAFAKLEASVGPRVKGQSIDTFVGAVDPGGKPVVVGPGGAEWQRQMLLGELRELHWQATRGSRDAKRHALRLFVFPSLIFDRQRGRVFADCTIGGMISDSAVAVPQAAFAAALDPETGRRYYLTRDVVEERDARGIRLSKLPIPPWVGPRAFAAALAFDQRRRRLVLASMGATFAAYDLRARAWQRVGAQAAQQLNFIRLRGGDGVLSALTYDAGRDCFWALFATPRKTTLHQLDTLCQSRRRVRLRLPVRVQPGGRNGLAVHALGRHLAIVCGNWAGKGYGNARRTVVLDPADGSVFLQTDFRRLPRLDAPAREDWKTLWERLDGRDPYGALRLLARGRAPLVAFLRAQWERIPRPSEQVLNQALQELGDAEPVVRSQAFALLSRGGVRIAPRIEAELERQASPEVRLALRRLLDQFEDEPNLRRRLLRVLEGMDAPGAATFRRQLRGETD